MSESQRIPAVSHPLLQNFIRGCIDAGKRHVENSCPYRVGSIPDVAASTGNTHLNCSHQLPALLVNPTDGSVALVERPNRTPASSQEPRLRPHRYRLYYFASNGIHGSQEVALRSGDPDNAVAEKRVVGTGRN